jgi:hypothetical protein
MERILIAIDSNNINENAVSFACHLTRLTRSKLTAVFLEDLRPQESAFIGLLEGISSVAAIYTSSSAAAEARESLRAANIASFRELTAKERIPANIYLDKGIPAAEIGTESRFADLLIIDADTFSRFDEGTPSRFVKDILHDSACPVVIAPASFERLDNIVFCYDGSKASMFAMKQFSYLFPELRSQRAKVINLMEEDLLPKEQARLTEWLKCHYSDVEWIGKGVEAAGALFNYLLRKRDDFVVMGAYGHGLLASFFEPDFEEGTIRTTSLPIFVAHH